MSLTLPRQASRTTRHDDRAAIDKALSLIVALQDAGRAGIGVSELARRAEMSKSTAHRILGILERNSAVDRTGVAYSLGELFAPATKSTRAHDLLRDLLTPFLVDLLVSTQSTVHLAVLDGVHVTYLNKLSGHRSAASPGRVGARIPAYCTAVGKLLLAHDQGAMDATAAGRLKAWTPRTIATREGLQAEFAAIRRRGQAFDRGELIEDLHCVAGAITGPSGRPIAAFSVSGQADHFTPDDYAEELRKHCYAASRMLQSSRGLLVGGQPLAAVLRSAS